MWIFTINITRVWYNRNQNGLWKFVSHDSKLFNYLYMFSFKWAYLERQNLFEYQDVQCMESFVSSILVVRQMTDITSQKVLMMPLPDMWVDIFGVYRTAYIFIIINNLKRGCKNSIWSLNEELSSPILHITFFCCSGMLAILCVC